MKISIPDANGFTNAFVGLFNNFVVFTNDAPPPPPIIPPVFELSAPTRFATGGFQQEVLNDTGFAMSVTANAPAGSFAILNYSLNVALTIPGSSGIYDTQNNQYAVISSNRYPKAEGVFAVLASGLIRNPVTASDSVILPHNLSTGARLGVGYFFTGAAQNPIDQIYSGAGFTGADLLRTISIYPTGVTQYSGENGLMFINRPWQIIFTAVSGGFVPTNFYSAGTLSGVGTVMAAFTGNFPIPTGITGQSTVANQASHGWQGWVVTVHP